MFTFIHAADIHLDSPLLNLEHYEGAPVDELRVATREAFDNLIQLAIDESVDFLLIAGDLYDKDSPDFHTPIHVRKRFRELDEHDIPVFIIQGNHDATTVAKKAFESLQLPPNVTIFPTNKPKTVYLEHLHVAIHGQGFATKSVTEDLSAKYPPAEPGHFNIGLLHTNLGGRDSHDNYAPSTTDGLISRDYQYWALGHIHKRDKGLGGTNQIIHYSGNTQGRHIRESGPRGCTLVSVDDKHQISMKFRATDVWRWMECQLAATHCETPDDVIADVVADLEKKLQEAEDRSLAVRVRITGQSPAHRLLMKQADHWREQLRHSVLDAFESRVWLEKIQFQTQLNSRPETRELDATYGDLIAGIHDLVPGDEVLAEVREHLDGMLGKLPKDVRLGEGIDLNDEATVESLVNDAKELLVAQLLEANEPAEGGVV